LKFEYGLDERNMSIILDNVDASILSVEKAGGFVGTTVGMFAEAGGDYTKREFHADFDWFKYENLTKEWVDKV
jgi:alpha-N-arabinofuranosidase